MFGVVEFMGEASLLVSPPGSLLSVVMLCEVFLTFAHCFWNGIETHVAIFCSAPPSYFTGMVTESVERRHCVQGSQSSQTNEL